MSYKVDTIAPFRKEAKKLIKKYPSLKNELAELGQQLSADPTAGTPLGNNCYKIRLACLKGIR
jgi:mRNA-degrading endonuclease RelE of RelBE toxin-antitoxin system